MPASLLPQDADKLLGEFFSPGVEAADLPALFPLLHAREALNAFTTLFRGGSDETLVRIMVLREIGARSESPRWSPQELRAHFAYLDPVKLETVLHRLRDNGLLVWNGEDGLYQMSGPGRTALAALATPCSSSPRKRTANWASSPPRWRRARPWARSPRKACATCWGA